jgi:hypothetical protein
MMKIRSKSNGQLARAATNLGIGVAGLALVRLLAQKLPMFQDAGWIVKGKLTVAAGAVILVDLLLLFILVGFAIEVRAYLKARFTDTLALGSMASSLVFVVIATVAYTDFKPLTRAWPAMKEGYTWSFLGITALLLAHVVFLLYRNRDRMAALILHQPMPTSGSDNHSLASEGRTVFVGD